MSTISFWEISLKSSLGRLVITGFLPEELPNLCLQTGFDIELLSSHDSSTYHQLTANYHKDPFDRMLIWQAISNDYTLISVDTNVKICLHGLKDFVSLIITLPLLIFLTNIYTCRTSYKILVFRSTPFLLRCSDLCGIITNGRW
jgi:hypothetical protein